MTLRALRAVGLLSVFLLSGCGGRDRNDHTAPAPEGSPVTVGGSVTGLVGTVILQNNAGDDLSITANGAFKFATPVKQGSAFAVTVLKQPAGPSCAVTGGTGTARDNVTSVTVTCKTDPSTVYLPLQAYPVDNTTGGVSGLAVVSTKTPADPPNVVVKEPVLPMTVLSQSDGSPYMLIYSTVRGITGPDHVWSLSLTGDSALIPTQLSNLALPYFAISRGGHILPFTSCSTTAIEKKQGDPSSAFLILSLFTTRSDECVGLSAPSLRWVLIHLTDSPSTAALELTTLASQPSPLYGTDGMLKGLIAMDTTGHLNLYADETFTNSTQLLAGVTGFSVTQPPALVQAAAAYLTVNSSSGEAVYKIDSTGTLSADLYDFHNGDRQLLAIDQDHVYLLDESNAGTGPSAVVEIVQGVAQTLYTYPTDVIVSMDYANQSLVLRHEINLVYNVDVLATGAPSTPVAITQYTDNPEIDLVGNHLLVTHGDFVHQTGSAATEVLDLTGAAVRPSLAASAFVSGASLPVMMVNNLPDLQSLGSGEIDVMDLSHPTAAGTPLKTASGATYTFPAGTFSAGLGSITPTVGIGEYLVTGAGYSNLVEYNLSTGVITPITIANTQLSLVR
jgi:hypothetical protein